MPGQTVSLIRAGMRLAAITSVVQMLGLLWLGTVRALQGVAHPILLWAPASHALGWIQSHWFSSALFWFLLFAIVCELFRLGRPVLEWHREAVNSLADAIRQQRRLAPEVEDI
ncbi:MAG: hypothetical protein ACRD6B_13465 [Bryobacteraceae bacterium]